MHSHLDSEIKILESLVDLSSKEHNLKIKMALSKIIPDKIADILTHNDISVVQKELINKLSSKWIDLQLVLVKELDKQMKSLDEVAKKTSNK